MMKSYLRFEPKKTFGIISSPQCNISYDCSGNLAISAALQDVTVWNLRQAVQIATLRAEDPNYPYALAGDVTVIGRCPDKSSVIAGYSNGELRVFNYISKTCQATLRGHRSAISSVAFEKDGTVFASGGSDCDIFVWDLVAYTGLCKLRGHKDVVTGIAFMERGSQKLLISVSKDTLMKVWDLSTQHCIQTVVGHRCEIWSLAILSPSASDTGAGGDLSSVRVVTGGADDLLRGYRLHIPTNSSDNDAKGEGEAGKEPSNARNVADVSSTVLLGDDEKVLEYYGCVRRVPAAAIGKGVAGSVDKCARLEFNASGTILAAQSSGKIVELYRVRDSSETKKKMKRRQKRMREKAEKEKQRIAAGGDPADTGAYSAWDEGDQSKGNDDADEFAAAASGGAVSTDGIILTDELELYGVIRCAHKLRGFSFSPVAASTKGKTLGVSAGAGDRALVSLINNSLEVYHIPAPPASSGEKAEDSEEITPSKISVIELHGHRSDVRAVCLSSDGLQAATCSSDGVKIWSTRTHACLRTCTTGYGVSIAFAPGGRYAIAGTKDGKVQVVDTASGEMVIDQQAHNGAIWSLNVRPDGKGFMTGSADKEVKFWEFTVEKGGALGIVLSRQLQMTHDALCVRYSPTKSQDKLLLAVGLLDSTVKVFYDDSLKFFLSLYGHKLPVMCLDISSDCSLLVSGSADKTVKIWGLDFGDCHRSLIAHEDSVTAVRFQPDTHYFFSAGKDGVLKYWDADRFEQILLLPGHRAAIWGIDVAPDSSFCMTVGQDRSLRMWERGEDLVFIEEERERALEQEIDKAAEQGLGKEADGAVGGVALANAASIESVKGGEMLMDALDLVEAELEAQAERRAVVKEQAARGAVSKVTKQPPNPLLLGLSPLKYMVRCLRMVKAPDLEQALLVMPFHYVSRFVPMLLQLARHGLDIELSTRCAVFLLRCHQARITSTRSLAEEISQLQQVIRDSVGTYRTLMGTNLAALRFMKEAVDQKRNAGDLIMEMEGDNPEDRKRRKNQKRGGKGAKKQKQSN